MASRLVVLILTGLYVWWPAKGWSPAGFFTIRRNRGHRVFLRDLHAVGGFWLSLMLLIALTGGMPWTDVFGSQLKRLQTWTDSGYPPTWRSSRGIESAPEGTPAMDVLSLHHSTAVIGAYWDADNGPLCGAAYTFEVSPFSDIFADGFESGDGSFDKVASGARRLAFWPTRVSQIRPRMLLA